MAAVLFDLGPQGGEIHLDDCAISFPEGAVSEVTSVSTQVYVPMRGELETFTLPAHVDITPTVECKPRGTNFLKPITFRVPTWVKSFYTSRHDHQVVAKVLSGETQSNGDVVWDTIGTVEIGREDYIEFSCSHFCKFKACIERREVVYYGFDYFLCCDDDNNFTVVVCLSNETLCNRLLQKYSNSTHDLKIKPSDHISVRENDKLEIKMVCETPGFTFAPNDEEEMTVNEAFCQLDKYRVFDYFVLEREVCDETSRRVKINLRIRAISDRSRRFQVSWKDQHREQMQMSRLVPDIVVMGDVRTVVDKWGKFERDDIRRGELVKSLLRQDDDATPDVRTEEHKGGILERAVTHQEISPTNSKLDMGVHEDKSGTLEEARAVTRQEQVIDPAGGVINVTDCKIVFHKGTFKAPTTVKVTMEVDSTRVPEEYILISPFLYVESEFPLEKHASIELRSWCVSDGSPESKGAEVDIIHKSNDSEKWETLTTLPLTQNSVFEFTCQNFSPIGAVMKLIGLGNYVKYSIRGYFHYVHNSNFEVILFPESETLAEQMKKDLQKNPITINRMDVKLADQITAALEPDSKEYIVTPVDGHSFKAEEMKEGSPYQFRFRLERNEGARAARRVKLTSTIKINGVDQSINKHPFNHPLTPETSGSSNEEIDTDNQEPSESSKEKTDSDSDNKGGASASLISGERSIVKISKSKVTIGAQPDPEKEEKRMQRKKKAKKKH